LCHFHYLRQAALPIYEADRHANKALKKWVRGVRRVERAVEAQANEMAQITQGYCAAVRAALTDDGQAPLDPGGLKLQERLRAISQSLGDVATQKCGLSKPLESVKKRLCRALDQTALRDRVRDQAEQAGSLQEAVAHFLAVTQSFWPGLFHC
jgi:hypothetical protein